MPKSLRDMADNRPPICAVLTYWKVVAKKKEDPVMGLWAMVARQAMADLLRTKWNETRVAEQEAVVWQHKISAFKFIFGEDDCTVGLRDICDLYGPNVDFVRSLLNSMVKRHETFPVNWEVSVPDDDNIQNLVAQFKKMDHTCDEGDLTMGKKAAPLNTGKAGSISGSRGGPHSISPGSGNAKKKGK